MKTFYKIEILGWEKYNKKSTKNMPSVMISKRFFDDVKIQMLSSSGKLLYLFLLLRRGDVDTTMFECSHDDCVTSAGGRGVVVSTLLDQLQSFQLLTYEKIAPNIIEKNKKEDNKIEKKARTSEKSKDLQAPAVLPIEKTNLIIGHYCKLWKERYKANPLIRNKNAGQLKSLVKDLGFDKSCQLIEAYLQMPDQWFVTKRHDIPTLVSNLNAVSQFIETGKIFTRKEISQLDKAVSDNNLAKEIMENGI